MEAVPEVVAQASLIPLVTSIRPGKPFWLALRFEVHPGYTLSWTYPGDVGREMSVQFTAPEGFETTSVQFPAPQKRELSEKRVTYGYQGLAAAFVRVTPPKRLSTQSAYRFDVKANWMACKKECLHESMSAFIELTASFGGGKSAGDEELEEMVSSLPKPLSEIRARHEWRRGKNRTLVITADKTRFLEFFPGSEGVHKQSSISISREGHSIALAFDGPPGDPPHQIKGIVVAERQGKTGYYDVDIPWTEP